MKRQQANKRRIGAEYEERACDYLLRQGFRIKARNFTCRGGEIDIIAQEKDAIVFVEVRFRSEADHGDPLETVDARKQRRICRSASYYLLKNGFGDTTPVRFDVIAIYGNGALKHVENAFEFMA